MVQQAGPGSVAETGAPGGVGGAGPDELAAMRATPSGMAMLRLGTIFLPVILCRAGALPQTDEPIVTGLPAITGEDGRDGTDGSPGAPANPLPPGAPGGDGLPGAPGTAFINEDGEFCVVQPDGTIKCVALSKPLVQSEIGIGVFFDGGGSALTNETDVYQDVPFDCEIQGVRMLANGGDTPLDIAMEFYRRAEGTGWPPDLVSNIDKLGISIMDNTNDFTDRELPTFRATALSKGDGLLFRLKINLGTATKLKTTLLVKKV